MGLPSDLLATKLLPPAPRPGAVPRPVLLSGLSAGLAGPLVLVAAAAGFGKTALLSQWLASGDPRAAGAAWVSLDAGDSEPARFWSYVLAALDRIVPGVASSAAEERLTGPINTLAAYGKEVVLLLDDYHVIRDAAVHRDVAYLLDHLPPTVHLVISTRADPPLPLPRLRARGQVHEIRAADLRLTPEETGAFLTGTMALELTPSQVETVHRRTEGWVAALQLAGLALRQRPAPDAFLAEFAGTDRYIVDYLAQEVLAAQSPEVVDFLRRTVVLDRLCAPLCEAVAGAGQEMLDELERRNLFLIPLDSAGRWYRYHTLFADVLRARLVGAEERAGLHRRASDWFETAGELPAAIEHALAVPDRERVADLLETVPRMQFLTPIQTELHRWLAALPAEVVRRRPALTLLEAWGRIQAGDVAGAQRLAMTVTGPEFQGELAVLRGFLRLSRPLPDAEAVLADAEEALARLPEDNATFRGMAQLALGHATLLLGDTGRTETAFAGTIALGRAAEAPHLMVMGGVYLAAAQRAHGQHTRAQQTASSALDLPGEQRAAVSGRIGLLHAQLADLALERGDLDGADEHAERSVTGARLMGLPPMLAYSLLARARVRLARGDLDGALAELPANPVTDAFTAQVRLARHEHATVSQWAADQPPPSATDLLSGARPGALVVAVPYECEHVRIAPVQVWLALGDYGRALALLEVHAAAATRFGLGWLHIKVLALRALAPARRGDHAAPPDDVTAALEAARPEGHLRLFTAEGAPMAALLTRLRQARGGAADTYLDALLAADPAPADTGLLSVRETDVLRLIGEGLDNTEIARTLFIAPSTVKTHVNHLFGKLGVVSRTQAVARARSMGLL
ncbi:MAG: LuxR C-terminal-related transcriptional regulator [Actinoplanes sp.]